MARVKSNKSVQKQGGNDSVKDKSLKSTPTNNWKWVLFLFGFLLYANTINFGYVLDDKIVITSNQITKKGFDGILDHFSHDSMDGFWAEQYGVPVEELDKKALVAGGRYRPLSMVTYAIEWELFGESPGMSHFINALLYGCIGMLLYMLLLELFPIGNSVIWKSVPFWVTLLFLTHPLHVEVIANIKGRDEILNLLFGLLTFKYLLVYTKTKNIKEIAIASFMLFLSLFSKETTIAFVLLGPAMLYFFNKGNVKEWKVSFVWLLVAGVLYNVIRFSVVGSPVGAVADELMNNPFLNATESQRFATIFLTLAVYVKLILFPYPLTHDYYPYHLPFLTEGEHYSSWSSIATITGVLILIGLIIVFIKGLKSKSIYSFAILFFFATFILVSNVLFPVGVFMNERFMFIPSVGMSIALAYYFTNRVKGRANSLSITIMSALAIVILLFSVLTINRSSAWISDTTLSLTDVEISTGSAKVKMAAADAILRDLVDVKDVDERQEMLNEVYQHLTKSLEIYPEYFPPLDLLGKMYFEAGNYEESIKFYALCAERKPNELKFVENIYIIGNKLVLEGLYQGAFSAYEKALTYLPNEKRYLLAITEVSGKDLNNPSQAVPYIEKANLLFPNDIEIIEKRAIIYAMLGRFEDAIAILQPIYDKNPTSITVTKNLGIAYYQMGDIEKGSQLLMAADKLQKGVD